MKTLQTIDLTKEGEPQYIIFFYHKNVDVVYKVITNGYGCALSVRDECGIDENMRFGYELPKYILKKLN